MPQIDALKGLAIVGVMVQHAFTSGGLSSVWDTLYVGQAVPVFFVLMGLNAAASASRRGTSSLRGLYGLRYWAGRFDRLLVPFLALWPLALVAGLVAHESHIGPLALIGVYPLTAAPGNYFVTIMLEFAVVFPAVFWCFSRRPVTTTVILLAADIAFELAAGHISAFATNSTAEYIYEAAIPKYAVFIVAGMWLAHIPLNRRVWLGTAVLAAVGAGYLVLLHERPGDFSWLVPSFSRSTNFISCFYAILITIVGIRALPAGRRRLPGWTVIEQLGKASYHIFLVQIVWFGVVSNRSWQVGVIGIVASSLVGWLLYRSPLPALSSKRRADRPLPGAGSGPPPIPSADNAGTEQETLSYHEVQHRAARGALTVMVRGLLVRGIGLAGNIVIARILTPRDFGLVAIGNSIMVIGSFISSGGLSATLINRPGEITRAELRVMMGFQMFITVAATGCVLAAAVPFGTVMLLGAIMTASLIIDTTRVPNAVTYERRMNYGPLVRSEVAENLAWNGWAVATVLAGLGVWGIATAQIFRALVGTTAINLKAPVRLQLPVFSWRRSRGMLSLGLKFQAVSLVQLIREQGITFVIPIVGTLSVLGLWGIVNRLILIIGVLIESLWRVSFPAASRLLETSTNPGPSVARALRVGTTLTGLLAVPLIGTAPALIHVLFGPQWQGAVDAVPATCLGLMLMAAPASICFGFLMASGRSQLVLVMTIVDSVATWGVGLSLVPALGVVGLSFGILAGTLVQLRFVDYAMRRDLGISVLSSIGVQTLVGLIAAFPAWFLAKHLGANVASVLASGVVALGAYLLALAIVRRELVVDVVRVVRRTTQRRTAVA